MRRSSREDLTGLEREKGSMIFAERRARCGLKGYLLVGGISRNLHTAKKVIKKL